MQNILCFGDSLTAGYGLRNKDKEAYPALIQQKLNDLKLNYQVINAGLSGDTSAGGLNRLDYWLSQPISVFVLELGINDIIRGIPPATTLKNLQAIVHKIKARYPDVKLALMGMQIPAFIHSPVAAQFKEIFTTLARDNRMALLPFFLDGVAGIAQLNLPDHLHPNAEGYKVIAGKVWPVIEQLLND